MANISIGDIVFVHFPFSDLSKSKLRPALVLADAEKGDLILCQITSQPYTDTKAIMLQTDSFKTGQLLKISYIRPTKLFTAHISIIEKKVAHVKNEVRQSVVNLIIELLNAG